MERALELAGFFAAHAVWSVMEGETLVPILACYRDAGQREFRRIEADDLQKAVAEGKIWIEGNPDGVSCAVLVYDAFIPLPGGKTDCLMLEVRSYGVAPRSLSVALPYRHANKSDGFAVHRPKFIASPEEESYLVDYAKAFFRGVDQHKQGSAIWNAHLDETR